MKKIIYLICSLALTTNIFSQINSPNGDNIFYYDGAADVIFKYPLRGAGGRAFVHYPNNILNINYNEDFTGGTLIGKSVFFKDGGNSYISSGNLGIGTINPAVKLDVISDDVAAFFRSNLNTVPVSIINIGNPISTIGFKGSNSTNEYNVRVGVNGESFIAYTSNTERMRIDSNGNVGIGIFEPQAKLHVQGDLQNNGNILLGHVGETNYLTSREVDQQLGIRGSKSIIFGTYNDGWKDRMMINNTGNVGIGILNPQNKLDVNGTMHSKEVKVDMSGWSDFVFKKEYDLPTLEQVEKHIAEKGHLENIPSEKEVLENGINLGEMNVKLLQKIEELTLYMIEQNKRLEKVEKENKKLTDKIILSKCKYDEK